MLHQWKHGDLAASQILRADHARNVHVGFNEGATVATPTSNQLLFGEACRSRGHLQACDEATLNCNYFSVSETMEPVSPSAWLVDTEVAGAGY
jgi:hypothetical protein